MWPLAALAGVLLAAGLVELAAAGRPARAPHPRCEPLTRGLAPLRRRLRPRAPSPPPARIDAAGVRLGVGEVMALKAAAVPAALLAASVVSPLAPGRLGGVVLLLGPVAGFLAPDVWLRARARTRARAMETEQADVVDLLRVAVGAGLSPWRALGEVGRRHPGVLATELGAAARRVSLRVAAEEPLTILERRSPAAGIPALVAALRRADRFGASPGRALGALAAEPRS